LEQEIARFPSEEEIAARMGLATNRFRRLSQIGFAADPLSLDSRNDLCQWTAGNPETAAAWRQVSSAIQALPLPERSVILSFLEGGSLSEIGNAVGLTSRQVSQIKKQAITRLRIALGAGCGDPSPG
jgi:DNA-directed RNA polymerase specialized sigma subunit